MDGAGGVKDRDGDRDGHEMSLLRNSPASPLLCSHIVESDFSTSIVPALQQGNVHCEGGPSATRSTLGIECFKMTQRSEMSSPMQTSAVTDPGPQLYPQSPSERYLSETGKSYFAPKHMLNHTVSLPLSSTISTESSSVRSSYASSSSLYSSQAGQSDCGTTLVKPPERPNMSRDLSNWSTTSTQTIIPSNSPSSAAQARQPTSAPRAAETAPASRRRDGPIYPNQAFAVLQSQIYPAPYQPPPPLRTRSSHPSQFSTYSSSAASSRQSRENPDMKPGCRTEGNSPSPTPGLFSPSTASPSIRSETDDDSLYSSPFLHPSHRQAPKEYVSLVPFNLTSNSLISNSKTLWSEFCLPTVANRTSSAKCSSDSTLLSSLLIC